MIISSPITLEYAEELLLMADTGRCAVLDVSEVPKERPTGHNDNNGDGDGENFSSYPELWIMGPINGST